jgi:hypothetical protein
VQFLGVVIGEQNCIVMVCRLLPREDEASHDLADARAQEYMKDGSLYSMLRSSPSLLSQPKFQLSIALDIARGLNYLHGLRPPICHRDLSSKNILLDNKAPPPPPHRAPSSPLTNLHRWPRWQTLASPASEERSAGASPRAAAPSRGWLPRYPFPPAAAISPTARVCAGH